MRKMMQTKLRRRSSLRELEAAQTRHSILGPYKDFDEILKFIEPRDESLYSIKQEMYYAFIVEYQRAPKEVWSQILTLAFYPMLVLMANRMRTFVGGDEAIQIVVSSFLETIAIASSQNNLFVQIRRETFRRVVNELRLRQRHQKVFKLADPSVLNSELEEIGETWVVGSAKEKRALKRRFRLSAEDQAEMSDLLRQFVGQQVKPEDLSLVVRTKIHGESLKYIVQQSSPEVTEEEQSRIYERMKKRRQRALDTVQRILRKAQREGLLDSRSSLQYLIDGIVVAPPKNNREEVNTLDEGGHSTEVSHFKVAIEKVRAMDLACLSWWGALPAKLGTPMKAFGSHIQVLTGELKHSWTELNQSILRLGLYFSSVISPFRLENKMGFDVRPIPLMRPVHSTGPP